MKTPYFEAGDFSPCNSPGALLRRVHGLVLRRADQILFGEDLTFTQWIVLVQLRDGVAKTGADLCRNLNHDSGATTRLLDQLEARSLIERHRSSEDRRVTKLTLTPQGRALAKTLTPRVVDFWNELMSDFTHAEIDTLITLLRRLQNRLEEGEASSHADKEKDKVS
jgi:DNA-binding MarR family transcriptional regulator